MPAIAYVNGKFSPIEEAVVSVEDRGFQLGDGIYEVLRTYHGRLHAVEPHLRRLFRSLDAIELKHNFTADGLEKTLSEAVQRAGFKESLVYMQVTRGATKRAKEFPKSVPPTIVITVRELELPPASVRDRGVRLLTAEDIRWQRCDIKTVCLLANVLASQRARGAGGYEALFVDRDGFVTECASANVFMVKAGVVITPPNNQRILGGITRDEVVALVRQHGIALEERTMKLAELFATDEVFITGTTTEILPVVQVDDRVIGDGRPGLLTRKLYDLFQQHADR